MASLTDRIEGFSDTRTEMKARFIAAAHQGLAASHAPADVKQCLRDRIPEACAEELERWLVATATWFPMVLKKAGVGPEQITDDILADYLEQTGEVTAQSIRAAYRESVA